MLKDLVLRNRSYRRFYGNEEIGRQTLEGLVDLARLTGSTANRQPLKYFISCDRATNEKIYPYLAWAGYLQDWPGPDEEERPSAYIVVLGDTSIAKSFDNDSGITSQTIMLGAVEKGLGGCIIGSIKREGLAKELGVPDNFQILMVLALGRPKEKVVLDPIADDEIKYWRDDEGVHHVPKRTLEEVLVSF